MAFAITFEISPPGVFGLEEARTTVTPSISKATPFGFLIDLQERRIIDRTKETSVYRSEHEKIDLSLKLGDAICRILDNTMTVNVEAGSSAHAYSKASETIDMFLKHLEVSQGLLFKTRAIQIEEGDNLCPLPGPVHIGGLRIYDLNRLRDDLREAERAWGLSDDRIGRALEYFEHALFLFETALTLVVSSGRHSALCVSESFLNLWKCATSLVGDPGVRKDGYRRRCDSLGLDDIQKEALKRITRLRNDYDVAHYTLSSERMRVVQEEFGKAMATVRELIQRYKQYLRAEEGVDPAKRVFPERDENS